MSEYTVQIKQFSDDEVIKELGPFKIKRMAEKCEDGVLINLNYEEYYTDIIENPDTGA